jgi:putative ABC transport system substrate-binding protein
LARAFLHGLRDHGWIEGRTVVIERRSAEGRPERGALMIDELLTSGVDVLMVGGAPWLREAAMLATRKVPIVVMFPGDPVAEGLVASLAKPGGNLTGVTVATGLEFVEKQMQLLRDVVPQTKRVAIIGIRAVVEPARLAGQVAGVAIIPIEVDVAGQYDRAFSEVLRSGADAFLAAGGPPNVVNAKRLAAFATESRLPAIFGFREAVEAGGLMSYGPSFPGVFRQSARLVAKFLEGSKIGDVPTERSAIFELVVNLRTAGSLGLTIPASVLIRADEVIE